MRTGRGGWRTAASAMKLCSCRDMISLFHVEPLEHVGEAGGEANARVERGHADEDAGVDPGGAASETAAEAHHPARLRADRRRAAAGARTAVDLSHHLDAFLHCPRDRQP